MSRSALARRRPQPRPDFRRRRCRRGPQTTSLHNRPAPANAEYPEWAPIERLGVCATRRDSDCGGTGLCLSWGRLATAPSTHCSFSPSTTMSSSSYPSYTPGAGPSTSRSNYYRPATIAELAAQAQENLWDPSKGLKHWLRTAEKARRSAELLVQNHDYENAFVEYAKAATIVLEKLPQHREYEVLLNADQRHNLGLVSVQYL